MTNPLPHFTDLFPRLKALSYSGCWDSSPCLLWTVESTVTFYMLVTFLLDSIFPLLVHVHDVDMTGPSRWGQEAKPLRKILTVPIPNIVGLRDLDNVQEHPSAALAG